MASRTIQCFLCVTMVSVSGYKGQYSQGSMAYYGYPDTENHDPSAFHSQGQFNRRSEGTNSPSESTNGRSITIDSNIQKIQDEERRRVGPSQGAETDSTGRNENGSYKIVNKYPGPTFETRQGQAQEQLSRGGIVFPGPIQTSDQSSFLPKISEKCKNLGICEDVADYPDQLIASIVHKLGNDTHNFKVDELDPEIAQRFSPPDESELCTYEEKIIFPKAAQDKQGEWEFIINQYPNPLQGFKVEICQSNQSPCSNIAHFRHYHEARCKQKYTLRYMVGINRKDGKILEKPYRLPSCCSCIVKRIE